VKLSTEWGTRSNVSPPAGQAPVQARYRQAEADLTLLTSRGLTVTNTYLFDHNASLLNGSSIYNSHIAPIELELANQPRTVAEIHRAIQRGAGESVVHGDTNRARVE